MQELAILYNSLGVYSLAQTAFLNVDKKSIKVSIIDDD
jgi:hypothetical protein